MAKKDPIQYKGFTINYIGGEYRADAYANPQFTNTNLAKLKKEINQYLKTESKKTSYAEGGGVNKYILKRDEEHYYQEGSDEYNYRWVRSKKEATVFNDIEKAKEAGDNADADVLSFDEKQMYAKGGSTYAEGGEIYSGGVNILKNLIDRDLIKDKNGDHYYEAEDAIEDNNEEASFHALKNLWDNSLIKDESGDHFEEVTEYVGRVRRLPISTYAEGGGVGNSDVKVKARLEYPNPNWGDDEEQREVEVDLIGLVNKEQFEERKGYGLGYVDGSDMMIDAEGFDMHTVLEGQDELDYLYGKGDLEIGTATWEVIETKEEGGGISNELESIVKDELGKADGEKAMDMFGYALYDSRTGGGNYDYREMASEVIFEYNQRQKDEKKYAQYLEDISSFVEDNYGEEEMSDSEMEHSIVQDIMILSERNNDNLTKGEAEFIAKIFLAKNASSTYAEGGEVGYSIRGKVLRKGTNDVVDEHLNTYIEASPKTVISKIKQRAEKILRKDYPQYDDNAYSWRLEIVNTKYAEGGAIGSKIDISITNENHATVGKAIQKALDETIGGSFEFNYSQSKRNINGVEQVMKFIPNLKYFKWQIGLRPINYGGLWYKGYYRIRGIGLHNFKIVAIKDDIDAKNNKNAQKEFDKIVALFDKLSRIKSEVKPLDTKDSEYESLEETDNFISYTKGSTYAEGGEIGAYKVDEVLRHFIMAALWATSDDEDEPLESDYSYDDIPKSELDKLRKLIVKFIKQNQKILKKHNITDQAVGHDLFLDSQGHGAGFWDRGYGDDGDTLSKSASKIFASDQPYVGDDKKIYFKKGGSIKSSWFSGELSFLNW